MGRETSTQKTYVYTGPGTIRTEDGLRDNIEAGTDKSRAFVASNGWVRRHARIAYRLMLESEYEAKKVADAKKAKAEASKKEEKAKPAKAKKAKADSK